MTKAGEKWCEETLEVNWIDAQHVLRAFCAAVHERAQKLALANSHGVPHDPNSDDYGEAFIDIKRDLLGEEDRGSARSENSA